MGYRIVRMSMNPVVSIYTDGGLASNNPSTVGGSWAYVHVDAAGQWQEENYGFIEPGFYGLETISNNIAELVAVMEAIKDLPEGWSGTTYTDSRVTLLRLSGTTKWNGVPETLRCLAQGYVKRLGAITWELLGGHPSKAELAAGFRKDGMPCHAYNVRCDEMCQQAVRHHLSKLPDMDTAVSFRGI